MNSYHKSGGQWSLHNQQNRCRRTAVHTHVHYNWVLFIIKYNKYPWELLLSYFIREPHTVHLESVDAMPPSRGNATTLQAEWLLTSRSQKEHSWNAKFTESSCHTKRSECTSWQQTGGHFGSERGMTTDNPVFISPHWISHLGSPHKDLLVHCPQSHYRVCKQDLLQTEHKTSIWSQPQVLVLHNIINADQITNIYSGECIQASYNIVTT